MSVAPSSEETSAGAAMWRLAELHTGRVGYRRGVKAEGLLLPQQVIDCSGWVGLLLSAGMQAANLASRREVYSEAYIILLQTWSDRIIAEIEARTGSLISGGNISGGRLPTLGTIGLNLGHSGWESNHPRSRGINHIVQVLRRPSDRAAFVSEALGFPDRRGLLLTPLADWLDWAKPWLTDGTAFAADPFANVS